MNGLLVRVGIDSTDSGWNAPVRLASDAFAFVTITETKPLRPGNYLMTSLTASLTPMARRAR